MVHGIGGKPAMLVTPSGKPLATVQTRQDTPTSEV